MSLSEQSINPNNDPNLIHSIESQREQRYLEMSKKLLGPLESIFDPESQYLVVKSPEQAGKDELIRYEVIYRKESVSVKETYLHGVKLYILDFATMEMTINGRAASDNDLVSFRKRINQSNRDFTLKKVRLVIYPRSN